MAELLLEEEDGNGFGAGAFKWAEGGGSACRRSGGKKGGRNKGKKKLK